MIAEIWSRVNCPERERHRLFSTAGEASGPIRWFERLLRELGRELWLGDSAKIRASEVRRPSRATVVRSARGSAFAGFGYGFGYGVVCWDLEQGGVGFGALDFLHGDGGLHAGPGVAGDPQ